MEPLKILIEQLREMARARWTASTSLDVRHGRDKEINSGALANYIQTSPPPTTFSGFLIKSIFNDKLLATLPKKIIFL